MEPTESGLPSLRAGKDLWYRRRYMLELLKEEDINIACVKMIRPTTGTRDGLGRELGSEELREEEKRPQQAWGGTVCLPRGG